MKTLPFILIALLAPLSCLSQQCLALWHFDTTDSLTWPLLADSGQGFLRPVNIQTSLASGLESPNALQSSQYPAQGNSSLQAGLELEIALSDPDSLKLSFQIRASSTASRYLSLQLWKQQSWTPLDSITILTSSVWLSYTSPEFFIQDTSEPLKIRIIAVPDQTGNYQPVSASSYRSSGTLRFDQISLNGKRDRTGPMWIAINPLEHNRFEATFSEALNEECLSKPKFDSWPQIPTIEKSFTDSSGQFKVWLRTSSGLSPAKNNKLCWDELKDSLGNQSPKQCLNLWYNFSKPEISISEIMFNDPLQDSLEFIEIYNIDSDTAFLGQCRLQGVNYTFDSSFFLAPKSYFLLAKNSTPAANFFKKPFTQWKSGTLSNSGECVLILNQHNDTLALSCYQSNSQWPEETQGMGSSIEQAAPQSKANQANQWRAAFAGQKLWKDSLWIHATPGWGYQNNLFGFKNKTQSAVEGERTNIPLSIKQSGSENIWIKLRIIGPNYSKTTEIQEVSAEKRSLSWQIPDDNENMGDREFKINFEQVCNGLPTGLTESLIKVDDNDQLYPKICISECMPQNRTTFNSEAGYVPWIELYNPNNFTVNLDNYQLKTFQDSAELGFAILNAISIPPYQVKLILCDSSGQQAAAIKLKLPKSKGRINLISPDLIIQHQFKYSSSKIDFSLLGTHPCDSLGTSSSSSPGYLGNTGLLQEESQALIRRTDNRFQSSVKTDWKLFDISGKEIFIKKESYSFELPKLANGIYLLRANDWSQKIWVNP